MRRTSISVVMLITVAWFAVIVRHRCEAAGGSDSSGYFNEARLIASGHLRVPVPSPDFIPLGFVGAPEGGAMVPMYPPGYPLHLALFRFAPFWVTPVAAALCLLLMFALARALGLSDDWSIAAVLILGASPPFLLMSVQPMSDVVSMLWCMAAMLLALRARPVLAGVAFGMAVAVRPSNLLLALPLTLALRKRGAARALVGALPIGIAMLIFNHALHGSWLTTGYGSLRSMMSWTNPVTRLPLYVRWLFIQETPLIVPGALRIAFDKRVDRSTSAVLLVWFAVFFLFYSFFGPMNGWGTTRFLLPALPPLIVGTLFLIRSHRAIGWLFVAVIAINGWHFVQREHVASLHVAESIYPRAVAWAESRVPRDATVAAMQLSGSFFYYANRLTLRYDLPGARLPLARYAVVFDWEEKNLPGRWRRVDRFESVSLMQRDDVTGQVNPQGGAGEQRDPARGGGR